MNRKEKILKDKKGFSLIEMMVSVAILSIVVILIGTFAKDIFFLKGVFSNGLTAYNDARKVLQPIASEIRSASPSALGGYNIETAGDTTFTFYSDINNDGLIEKVKYYVSGTTLKKSVIPPTGSMVQYSTSNEKITDVISNLANGSTPVFTYYDTNYNGQTSALTQPVSIMSIRLVKITLIIDANAYRSPSSMIVTTQVSLRNLKDNL